MTQQGQRIRPVRHHLHPVSRACQPAAQHLPVRGVVIDHQDVSGFRGRHRGYRDARRIRVGDRQSWRRIDPVSDHGVQRLRGAGNSIEILAHFYSAHLLCLRLELIGGCHDGAYGPGRLGAKAAQIDFIVLARAPEHLIY